MEDVLKIDGETQAIGFGEFAESAYVEMSTYNPKYVEYLINEGDHLDVRKFAERIMQKQE